MFNCFVYDQSIQNIVLSKNVRKISGGKNKTIISLARYVRGFALYVSIFCYRSLTTTKTLSEQNKKRSFCRRGQNFMETLSREGIFPR